MTLIRLATFVLLTTLAAVAAAEEKKEEKKKPAKLAPAALVGTWEIAEGMKDGDKIAKERFKGDVVITKSEITMTTPDETFKFTYKLDPKATPAAIDMSLLSPEALKSSAKGIVAVEEGKLKLAYHPMHGDRPKDFTSKKGSGIISFILTTKTKKDDEK